MYAATASSRSRDITHLRGRPAGERERRVLRRARALQHVVTNLVVAEEIVALGQRDKSAAVPTSLLMLAAPATVESALREAAVRGERAELAEEARAPAAVVRLLHRMARGDVEVRMNANQAAPRRALIRRSGGYPSERRWDSAIGAPIEVGIPTRSRARRQAELPQLVGIEPAEGRSGLVSLRRSDAYGRASRPGAPAASRRNRR